MAENTSRTPLDRDLHVESALDPPHVELASKSNRTASALTQNLRGSLVTSTQDLSALCSHFSDDSRREFQYASFAFVTEDYTVYFGRSPTRKVTPAIVNESLRQVPDEDVYPVAPSHATIAIMTTADSSVFIKRPSFPALDALQGSGQLANLFLQELEVLELLANQPHPNIIRFYGCQVCRGRIVGLTLERHPYTLQECLINGRDLDLVSGQDEIKSAVAHLHSLGLAHNDIRPSNIMVSIEGKWILIDMGACKPFGQDLIMSGNPDWITSSKQNDEAALRDLQIMLHNEA